MLGAMPRFARAAALRRPGGALLDRLRAGLRRLAAPYCAVCRVERGDPVCPGCLQDFFDARCVRCPVCAGRLFGGACASRCGRCLAVPPSFDRTIALGDYAPPVDGMVMALKSGARLDLASVFGELLAERIDADARIECLFAVPLSDRRQRERGFNQSVEIARVIARRLSVPLARRPLARVRGGPPQQSLPLAQRQRNVRGAFAALAPLSVRRAAVVDDVMTSGATLDEIAQVLKRAGLERVVNLVIARTP
jgi:ComF family protein